VRALLLYNPNAQTTTPAVIDDITMALSAELKLDVEATKRRDHAGFLAAGAVHEGYEVVIVLGGDGTVNEVLQGVAETPVHLAVVPGGSTNVFTRILGLPRDPVEATSVILRKLRDGDRRTVNLGMANDRYFSFCAGWGYDAEVVRMVDARARLKRTVRQATFLWCGFLAKVTSRSREADATLRTGDDDALSGLSSLVCCNADPYTFLGPLRSRMCPEADLDLDLDVTGLTRSRTLDLARVARVALTSGRVDRLPFVRTWHDMSEYTVTNDVALPVHTDGEFLGETATLRLRSVPRGLTVVA